MIQSVTTPVPPSIGPSPRGSVRARIDDALRAVGYIDRPAFTLTAIPNRTLDLRVLFEARNTSLVELLESPPKLRVAGFDLDSGRDSRIVHGHLRRAMIEDYALLEFHRDGVAIYAAAGDDEGLCWGRPARQQRSYLINQMWLVEKTYLFCLLMQRLYDGHLQPGEIVFLQMEILRVQKGDQNFFLLEPGPLDTYGRSDSCQAPAASEIFEVEIRYGVDLPERAAILLLSELYTWMGYEEERIPYTTASDGVRVVDRKQLVAAGRRIA